MEHICGVTFAPFAPRGTLAAPCAAQSLRALARDTAANWVVLAPAGVQATAFTETIDWQGPHTCADEELLAAIALARSLGLKVALKPTVNCLDGTWRAHIRFFDHDVPCEPKWCNWFASYTAFQCHYAALAQSAGCDLFITGCEMVETEHREGEWRALLAAVRAQYAGPVSYNTDKYGEDHVNWWDAVDVISSSGYYPLNDWPRQLDRIEGVVRRFDKPFFFAEAGCMNVRGSAAMPNDWTLTGARDDEEPAAWYRAMFDACAARPWVGGWALWDWPADPENPSPYALSGRPALAVVRRRYSTLLNL